MYTVNHEVGWTLRLWSDSPRCPRPWPLSPVIVLQSCLGRREWHLLSTIGRRINAKVHGDFLQEQFVKGRAVAGVDPVACGGVCFLVLALAENYPVVTLRPGDGGGKPDLSIERLFVEYIGPFVGDNQGEDPVLSTLLVSEGFPIKTAQARRGA